ncbi:MAG: PilZ domain-containing protein [Chromatiaceae bacterium]|nr:PilZ domain-containing protein [Gammaproteobacteria bacterium]MCP5313192.1 PilZ domain-containing protein [Chromatiaceae bacterium]
MDDRRKNNRIDAYDAGLRVIDGIDDSTLGIVGNLSLGGMMLITNRQLYADGILQLKIEPPPGFDASAVSMGVKILWCTPANSPDEYWAGLETIDIGPSEERVLLSLLDHLATPR